jgi:hypothetical protein
MLSLPALRANRSGQTVPGERAATGVPRRVCEFFFDPQQLVVLRDTFGPGRRTRLDLTATGGNGEIGDRGVLGLAGPVAHHAAEGGAVGQVDGVEGLGERADLVDLHQHRVGGRLGDAPGDPLRIGDEQVVADDLDTVIISSALLAPPSNA